MAKRPVLVLTYIEALSERISGLPVAIGDQRRGEPITRKFSTNAVVFQHALKSPQPASGRAQMVAKTYPDTQALA
jgi:hypothetical protein